MGNSTFLLLCLLLAAGMAAGEDATTQKPRGRQPRNFDGGFADYYKRDESEDSSEKPVYSDGGPRPTRPPQRSEPYGNFRDSINYPGGFPVVFKGYPYYSKGTGQAMPAADMMSMMDVMKQLQEGDSGKEPGFLQKLVSDPKTILAVALIPLSIMLASFVPLVVNYFMSGTGGAPSIVSTLASGGGAGRSLGDSSDFLGNLLRGIERYGRSLESGDCLEEAVCRFVTDASTTRDEGGLGRVKLAARSLSRVLKTEWVGDGRFATLLSGIRQKDCSDLCVKSRTHRMKEGDLSQ